MYSIQSQCAIYIPIKLNVIYYDSAEQTVVLRSVLKLNAFDKKASICGNIKNVYP